MKVVTHKKTYFCTLKAECFKTGLLMFTSTFKGSIVPRIQRPRSPQVISPQHMDIISSKTSEMYLGYMAYPVGLA